jgi:hypothetical protein
VSGMSETEELAARVAALESAAFRTGHDLGEIRRVQDEHTGHLEAVQLGLDGAGDRLGTVETRLDGVETRLGAVETKLEEAARLADTRHTAVTTMLQEVLSRLGGGRQE